jgi:hypothetical protein
MLFSAARPLLLGKIPAVSGVFILKAKSAWTRLRVAAFVRKAIIQRL